MKTIIYLRTSTEEQNPENQLKDCLTLVGSEYELFEEKQSAFKDKERPIFNLILKEIKKGNVKCFICWDLDRIYRKRKKLIEFFQLCKINNCSIHSFRQRWLEKLNSIPEPFNEIMKDMMIQIMGWLAQEESEKKSDRIKNAVRRDGGITKSRLGNKWGRKALPEKVIDKIIELKNNGVSVPIICEQVSYWNSNNNKKNIARSTVYKILKENDREKD